MINTPLVTVAGNYDVTDDIIFCDVLQFVGVTPQLVIRPMTGAQVGARRLLKIVANTIDTTGSTGATITYNMDNNTELPLGNIPSFADPTTQAKTGAAGSPSSLQIPFVDIASPNWLPIPPGPFPKAADGGDGYAGGRGGIGAQGMDGPTVEIWTTRVIGSVTIDLRGQQGGNGGNGGNGQFGGTGQAGSEAVTGYRHHMDWRAQPRLRPATWTARRRRTRRKRGLRWRRRRWRKRGLRQDILHERRERGGADLRCSRGARAEILEMRATLGKAGKRGRWRSTSLWSAGLGQNSQDGPMGDTCGGDDQKGGGGISQPGGSGANGTVTTYARKGHPAGLENLRDAPTNRGRPSTAKVAAPSGGFALSPTP